MRYSGYVPDADRELRSSGGLRLSKRFEYVRLNQGIAIVNSKNCPYCAETIKAEARVCRHCGRDLKT